MNEVSIRYTNAAERIANQGKIAPGLFVQDRDSGSVFMRTTSGWAEVASAGAWHVLPKDRTIPGLYDDDKTVTAASDFPLAIPVNADGVKAKSVSLYNLDPTNFCRAKFGDSAVAIGSGLNSGHFIKAGQVYADQPVPQDADTTHLVLRASTADVIVAMVWGF